MGDVAVTEAHDGRTLHARVGDTVTVRLPEPATSGYRWEISGPVDDGLEPAGDRTNAQRCRLRGRWSSTRTLAFRAQRSGTLTLALRLRRSWESEGSALRRFHVTIVVGS